MEDVRKTSHSAWQGGINTAFPNTCAEPELKGTATRINGLHLSSTIAESGA
jgi:hypothetical protein